MANTPSDIQARKLALRQRIIAARDNLTPTLRAHSSKHIVDQITDLAIYKSARTVLGYLNFGSEMVSEAWIRQALTDGKRVLLPRVNKASKRLELFEVKDLDSDVVAGTYGIREPVVERCGRFEALGEIDLILMPGVAFDREGGRLGYGGGYFDKLLAHLPHRPALIAGAFAMQMVAEVPQEASDYKVDYLITENELIRCNLGRE
jgi:5-formyltetrahydrofolate cyclo-ligase